MRLPVKYPELVSVFMKARRNLKNTFRDIEEAKNLKTIGAYTKSTDLIFIHLVTLPL
jgi:hypothetical protein